MPLYGSADLSMAQAPSGSRGTSPTSGQLYYDTDVNTLYAYTGTIWKPVGVTASGGTETAYSGYKVHTFLLADSGNGFVVSGGSLTCDILVVAGGGGGGGAFCGGGGGGGVVYSTGKILSSGVYTITIGDGGDGGKGWDNQDEMYGKDGTDTTAFSYVASGGGGGSSFRGGPSYGTGTRLVHFARVGGSGGGGSSAHSDMDCEEGGASDQAAYGDATVYGNSGGTGYKPAGPYNGGGGGGAGAVGGNGDGATSPGDGGAGQGFSIRTGSTITYAGGGGGSSQNTGYGSGGSGGGGAGTVTTVRAADGTANTGGGGGAGGYDGASDSQMGGNGGSGIVIVRYAS
jgi:hypothetical protein